MPSISMCERCFRRTSMRSRRPSMSCRLVNLDEATGRILRPSWAGEVAARSRKSREATDFAQTGWLLRRFFRSDLDPPPRLALYGRSAIRSEEDTPELQSQ